MNELIEIFFGLMTYTPAIPHGSQSARTLQYITLLIKLLNYLYKEAAIKDAGHTNECAKED